MSRVVRAPASIAFVLPYGEPSDGFFPDTLAGLACARARALGHRAEIVRVYYDGRDAREDARIAARLEAWLAERAVDLLVLERVFDPAPLARHLQAAPGRTSVLLTRGEPFAPSDAIEWVIGAHTTPTARGTKRSPELGELLASFEAFLEIGARAPGVAHARADGLVRGAPSSPAPLPRPLHPVLAHDIIAPGEPPRVRRKTLFGNAGCPYGSDPLAAPHYAGLAARAGSAQLGCAFCPMGGDYQKRPDALVVEELIEQARFVLDGAPDVDELVLSDQHALRYLAALMRAAEGLRPVRWLFAARADAFVRERARVEAAIEVARDHGHVLEVYLSGFEAFHDAPLSRFHKGATVTELLAAVDAMRALHAAHPSSFAYARARGHSLVLFDPWTTPDELEGSVATMRAHGLGELFDEIGRNRLRLSDELPIAWAAARDGALTDAWEEGDEGAARRKGYPTERPWRFLDPRARTMRALAEALRERLGPQTELAQLAAAARFAKLEDAPPIDAVIDALDRLSAVLASRTGGAHRDAAVVRFAGACNDGCPSCPNRDRFLPDDAADVLGRVAAIVGRLADAHPVVFAGREPTIHPAFADALARAAAPGRAVAVVSNGRRFGHAPFAAACVARGLSAASLKVFAPDAPTADRIARVEHGHAQALEGARNLRRARLATLELRAPIHAETLASLPAYVELALAHDADALFVECAIDALGLAHLDDASRAIEALVARADAAGLAIEMAPLRAGMERFDRLPTARRGARAGAA